MAKSKTTRRSIPIEEKIQKAEDLVNATKQKYDNAVKQRDDLLAKKAEAEHKEILEAIQKSKKTHEEILEFLAN